MAKIQSFRDLETWQEGHKLVLEIYRKTESFPKKEQFGLTSQIRRAVLSITSNIAEGFGRRTYKEKARFYYISKGSLLEAQNQLLVAKDLGYLSEDVFKTLADQSVSISKLLTKLIKSSELKK